MARQGTPFDEIMIVNPINYKGERLMKFYPTDTDIGYVAEGPYEPMGYVADPPPGFTEGVGYEPDYDDSEAMGYINDYPEDAEMSDEMGYFAEDEMEDEEDTEMGYFADDEMGNCGEKGDEDEDDKDAEMGNFAEDYDEDAEMGYFGDGEDAEMGYFAENTDESEYDGDPEIGYFGEEPEYVDGYIPETEPSFNHRCMPVKKVSGIEGYIEPKSVNPTCTSIRPANAVNKNESTWFKPLW